ncbi:hypothetical protein DUNSADRAFT_13765 [Dunaliella salina]|uniref:Uncharacterized protein n=1 Tax=Dunaliella salina TaxID=3046 RepID=A0ABQ7G8S6_DUNSA|nr:hypothetical protein DUNSADRAFT_13765 [Dunaliella salina]|eukprot:KAF5831008.1 hypothetical protein DUNSADRAFT_13765 [Dunaliella salina]
MHMVTKNMSSITKSLEQSVQSNNLERIQKTMDQFEKQFENLDMQGQVVEGVMGTQANLSTPEEDVNSLINQVRLHDHSPLFSLHVPRAPHSLKLASGAGPSTRGL